MNEVWAMDYMHDEISGAEPDGWLHARSAGDRSKHVAARSARGAASGALARDAWDTGGHPGGQQDGVHPLPEESAGSRFESWAAHHSFSNHRECDPLTFSHSAVATNRAGLETIEQLCRGPGACDSSRHVRACVRSMSRTRASRAA